jgi:WhiB family transcriptional regulator, redox-sensing transcriptional regulator
MTYPDRIEYAASTPKPPAGGTVRGLDSNLLAMPRAHGVPLDEQLDDEQLEQRKGARQLTRMLCDHPCELDPDNGITECHHPHHDRDAAVVREMLQAVGLDGIPARSRRPADKECTRCRVRQPIEQFYHRVNGVGCTIRVTAQCSSCRGRYTRSPADPADEIRAVTSDGWMLRGACRDEDPELFHPEGETEKYAVQIGEAKAVCAGCPVVLKCYAHVIGRREFGIWAGMTESERDELRNDLDRKRCSSCTRTLPLSEFYRRRSTNALRSRCKGCENRKRAVDQRQARVTDREQVAV